MKAFVFLLVTLGAGAAYVPAPPLRHRAHSLAARWPPIVASLSTLTDAATSTASLTSSSTPTALLADGGLFDSIAGIGALGVGLFVVVALLAGKGSLEAGAALMLVFFRGDPDEREASGANENELLKKLALSITPSAWKKAYQGEEGVEGSQALLDLPSWQGEEARALVEPEAVANIRAMQYEPFVVPGISTPVDTCFISQQPEGPPSEWPTVMLVHGFDSSLLEFRYIVPALLQAGLRVEAMEWFTGGFTARAPFLAALEADPEATPWDLARAHQLEFWKRQCAGQKVVLLGASLGGALAIDFAAAHPECVDRLVLMDAGGESYAQPEPFLTSLAADPVTNLFAWRAANGLLPYPHVWSKEGGWRQALRAYLKSGGYQNRVGPELIRMVPQPTFVLWGEEDDVLDVQDAYKYQRDLPNCVGVALVPDAQHAPALENPAFVAEALIKFTKGEPMPAGAPSQEKTE